MGVDPYLQDSNFSKRIRLLSGFAAQVRTGYNGNGSQVKNCTVSSVLTAIGQTITLACDSNPTKVVGSKRLLPYLQIMLDGYKKVDPATRKKLPVQSNIPELLVKIVYQTGTIECQRAMADLTMIAFDYLLWVGKYTIKGMPNNTKQTVNSSTRMCRFSRKIAMANSDASHVMLLQVSSLLLKAPHSNWTTNRMGGKACVCITN